MIRKSLRIWVKAFEFFKSLGKSLRIVRLIEGLKVNFKLLTTHDMFSSNFSNGRLQTLKFCNLGYFSEAATGGVL